MHTISPETIEQLGRLARLNITPEEKLRYAEQLTAVVGYIDQLSQVSTQGVEQEGVTGLVNVMAADQPRSKDDPLTGDYQQLLAGVPHREEDFILVRAVMAEEGVH